MAIFRCNHCAFLLEQADALAGQNVPCAKCGKPGTVYPTLFFIEKLLEKYFVAQKALALLKQPEAAARPTKPDAETGEIDLGNTDLLASDIQHGPIFDWFEKKHIKVRANLRGVDTSGFFDEIALALGENFGVLKEVVERIRWSQKKEANSATIHLAKKSPADAQALTAFCQQLYDFSFVAKRLHNREENSVRLILQTAPTIRDFFNGEWLEWFALMITLRYAKERKKRFSCARNLSISLQNGDAFELDVFMLIDGNLPICIECKTGEFRQDIDKYLSLRKRLGLEARQFILCVTGLSDEQAKGLTAMYDLSFVNERELATHLARLF